MKEELGKRPKSRRGRIVQQRPVPSRTDFKEAAQLARGERLPENRRPGVELNGAVEPADYYRLEPGVPHQPAGDGERVR